MFHGYADDQQLYISVRSEDVSPEVPSMEDCIADVHQWMTSNFLKVNDDKTDFIVFGTQHQLAKIPDISIFVDSACVKPSHQVKNLGVLMDRTMSCKRQVLNTAKSANFHLSKIGKIRKYIDSETCKTMINSYVTSILDYCNSLMSGTTLIQHLQRIQNKAARMITRTRPSEHITPILHELHWLPVKDHITFKQLLLTYSTLKNDSFPQYLKDLLSYYQPPRSLRSSSKLQLSVPSTNSKLADNAFSVIAPKLWNSLPLQIRSADSISSFKRLLKTHLFTPSSPC